MGDNMDYLMLIDKFNAVPEGFEQTISLEAVQGKLLESQACRQCRMLLRDAEHEGINIKVLSAYRSCDYQQSLWEKSISERIGSGMSYKEAVNDTSRTLAKSGHSEHNCGLAVDFSTPSAEDTEDNFHTTPQGRWLCMNAHKYGFILRYPRMKEHYTGIDYEPWHYRYVGTEAAEFIRKSGLCLEEFLHFYSEKFI
ncbi:M15 family metallopeptidase [Ruminococcus sp. Marseille-P6503]|uniref:M15 family metallopeptidase n=1 Tax=Ruminococcus sp. Marseille-P6503 TaxID=2364796 RepID=UPI000F547F65|nr:M15 family metallopeptidase [Ruminococcus sp. Marseille-P6503]